MSEVKVTLTSEDKELVPIMAKAFWNAFADPGNQWDTLSQKDQDEEIERIRSVISKAKKKELLSGKELSKDKCKD